MNDKKNKYWNTVWSDRDEEFYWSGVKFGTLYSAIMVSCIWGIGLHVINSIKSGRKESEEESQ